MTAKPKPPRTCPECRFDGGWHYDEAGNATRCPQYLATEAMPELNGNHLREAFEDARVDTPVIGAAFSACARDGVIEATGRYVQSTEATTRHRIAVWRSLRYRGSAA